MRLFMNVGRSKGFQAYYDQFTDVVDFAGGVRRFIDTRYGAPHLLQPVLAAETDAFCTTGDDLALQTLWARENGLPLDDLEGILRAQIEHHRTEVFYNLDPMRFGSAFVRKLPGHVKKSICWRAAPSGDADLSQYDLVVCNFPSIIQDWRRKGCRAEYLSPAHDPMMDDYAGSFSKQTDLIFSGGFSRHHLTRVEALKIAAAIPGIRVKYHLEDSRLTRLANALPLLPGLGSYRHPAEIRRVRAGPLYGRELYAAIGGARIVLNGAVDMAGDERGNMRCFEATGCGALLLTDAGRYPDGFTDGSTMLTYAGPEDIPRLVERALGDMAWSTSVADAGHRMVRSRFTKERQWTDFQTLL
jgi:hypothetical protein